MRIPAFLIHFISEAMVCAVVLATLYLMVRKAIRNSLERYRRYRERFFSPRLVIYLCQDSNQQVFDDLRPRRPGDRGILFKLLLAGADKISGDTADRLEEAFLRFGFVHDFERLLRHRHWWLRAEAAYYLGVMRSPSSIQALREALSDPYPEVSVAASRALAAIEGAKAFPDILRHFKDPSRWASHEVADIFIGMGPTVCPLLLEHIQSLSTQAQRLVIDVVAYFHDAANCLSLLTFLSSPDVEVRARTIKALGAGGDPRAAPHVRLCLEDMSWQVRLLACVALGTFKDVSSIPSIARHLSDRKLRVRVVAAQTLRRFGPPGLQALENEQRFAKGPARVWLKQFLAGWVIVLGLCAPFSPIAAAHADSAPLAVSDVGGAYGWREWVPPAIFRLHARVATTPTYQIARKGVQHWLKYRRQGDLPVFLQKFLYFYDNTVIFYFIVLNLTYVILFVISFGAILRYMRRARIPYSRTLLHSPMVPPISILVPAYNEDSVIVESVRSFLTLRYQQFEVIVINDGSRDRTLQRLQNTFELKYVHKPNPGYLACGNVRGVYESPMHPNLVVIDKANGGKSDALNAGLNYARYPLFCTVDADSILEPEALLRVVKPFMQDPTMVAVGGVIRIANGNKIRGGSLEEIRLPDRMLPMIQIVEYMRAFFSGRMGWSAMHSLLLISGAFGLFQKEAAIRCGGYRTDTVGEDMDLVVRMHRSLREEHIPYRMVFIPDPVCWTEAPESMSVLRSQRDRWQRGLVQTLARHMVMLLNPRYGAVGLVAFPYFVCFEMVGPVIEFGGYIAMILSILLLPVDVEFIQLFFFTAILFGALMSVGAVLMEEMSFHRYPRVRHMLVLVLVAFFENFGYRQINAWWRCKAVFTAFNKQLLWGNMTRKGFAVCLAAGILMGARLASAESLYDLGNEKRLRGDFVGAKETFGQLLEKDPASGGALEGLSLSCLSLRQYDEAARYLERWNKQAPGKPYVYSLLARAYQAQGMTEKRIETFGEWVRADPRDLYPREKLDSLMRAEHSGLFPYGRIRKSVGPEGLSTRNPQRIVYEGAGGNVAARWRLAPRFDLLAGVDVTQDAQRNDTRGFTYYDLLEEVYTIGFAARPVDSLVVESTYGQSRFSDIETQSVGKVDFSRANVKAGWEHRDMALRIEGTRAPRLLRGTGSDRFFAILRRATLKGTAEADALGASWRLQGGVDDYSEGTQSEFSSLQGSWEWGDHLIQARGSHSQQEFYGATPDGKLGLMDFNRASLRYRLLKEERYRLDASYGSAYYRDRNRVGEADADAEFWIPFAKRLSTHLRFTHLDYARPDNRYESTDGRAVFVGGRWRQGWGGGLWSALGYDHGFRHDESRRSYEDNSVFGEWVWYWRQYSSIRLEGRGSRSTVHDLSHSALLEARVSF